MLSGRCAVPDSWTRISRISRNFLLAGGCFPTRISRIFTPSEFFHWEAKWESPLLATKKIRGISEIRVRLLFLNHIAKIQHFIFPTHRCSLLLTDTHRLSLINIRVLPNGRKYRILAEDWTPCSSCCIHSSATARRAGYILLSISSDGLLPRPGRNPENRAGLTPALCNFVNPLTVIIMLNVKCWTRISRISRIFRSQATYSFNSCNSCSVNPISNSCSEKTIRNSCSVKTLRNSRAEKYLLGLCFVTMILSHRTILFTAGG